MAKELIEKRNKVYSNSPTIFWTMSIFCILVLIGFIALDAVVPSLSIITLPIFFFPLLFACFAILFSIKYGGTVTLGTTFTIGLTYFRSPNFGCFNLLKNLLKGLLVYFVSLFIFMLVLNPIFLKIYGQEFIDSYQGLIDFSMSTDVEAMQDFLNNNPLIVNYLVLSNALASTFGILFFTYGVIFSSISVYVRMGLPLAPGPAITGLVNEFFRYNRRSYRRDFWFLNWPVFLLLILGNVVGYLIVILIDMEYFYLNILPNIIGFGLMLIFLPFMFANMEALFDKYSLDFKKTGDRLARDALSALKRRSDINEEEKRKIEEFLEEGNKKDSNDNEES